MVALDNFGRLPVPGVPGLGMDAPDYTYAPGFDGRPNTGNRSNHKRESFWAYSSGIIPQWPPGYLTRPCWFWKLLFWNYRLPWISRFDWGVLKHIDVFLDSEWTLCPFGSLRDGGKGWFVLALCRPCMGICIYLLLPGLIFNNIFLPDNNRQWSIQ